VGGTSVPVHIISRKVFFSFTSFREVQKRPHPDYIIVHIFCTIISQMQVAK
jgi:hypothetical protein